ESDEMVVAVPVAADSPGARRLIALSDQYMNALYPAGSNHLESERALLQPNVCFVGIEADNTLAACGAVKLMTDDGVYGEIKRVFVLPTHRGRGYARSIMHALEEALRLRRVGVARLETGILQPEALRLYRALGYRERRPFGAYVPDPLSLFMEKAIDSP
ncbi:MAG: GNAT family N-acetyltransferase, partial [Steroidobacteraceae bacterium]